MDNLGKRSSLASEIDLSRGGDGSYIDDLAGSKGPPGDPVLGNGCNDVCGTRLSRECSNGHNVGGVVGIKSAHTDEDVV